MATDTQVLPQLLSGARGTISIKKPVKGDDGKFSVTTEVIAIATDISVSVRHDLRPVYLMGSMNASLIEPTGIDVDCSIGRVIPIGQKDALKAGSTSISAGFEYSIDDVLSVGAVDITITDSATQKIISSVIGARFTGRSTGVSTGDLASERYNFVGIYDAGYGGLESSATTGYGSGVDS